MNITYVKSLVSVINPFDDQAENVVVISAVDVDGTIVKSDYSFSLATTDADILASITSDLTSKGYV